MGALGEHFRSEDSSRHSEWLRQQRWFIKSRQDRQRREEAADKLEIDVTAFAVETVMATQAQIKAFEVKLDSYDKATVVALMENQELIDAVKDRLSDMLARAYVMDDGRRVFKTEDGTQVFDEFGVEVSVEELDPDLIDNNRPTYEEYAADAAALATLEAERTQILEFQVRVDAAREDIANGEISEAELEELDAELLDAMPPTVRSHVSGLKVTAPQTNRTVEPADQQPDAPIGHTQSVATASTAPTPFQ